MVDTAEFPYRAAPGHISVATIEGNDAYLLSNYPLQSDQTSRLLNPWGLPSDDITLLPAFTRYGKFSDQGQWADGPISFTWGLKYVTELMAVYWETYFWTADIAIQRADATVKTRISQDTGLFKTFWVTANRPKPNVDYKRGVRGYNDYITEFTAGIVAT